jgi:NADP-dependent 3-hydroxy acid dehydrogenase YdfG
MKFWSDAAKWSGDMDDMVAFITGAGSGIGQAAAKLLARRGARVALAGRTPDQLAEVAEAIGGDQRHRDWIDGAQSLLQG